MDTTICHLLDKEQGGGVLSAGTIRTARIARIGRKLGGMSMIELLIALAVLGLLTALGLPSFNAWLHNTKLRTAAESLQSGLQMGRAEAVRQNRNVEFVLTNDMPIAANVNALVPSIVGDIVGANWVVRVDTDPDPAVTTYDFISGKSAAEGSTTTVVITAPANTITFTGLGRATLAANSTFQVTNPAGGACAALAGPMRCLNVTVAVGGQVKMCDPAVATAGDSRRC